MTTESNLPNPVVHLYLDIDGVLHPDVYEYDEDNVVVNDDFMFADCLEKILDKFPEVKVVLHSAWRYLYGPTSAIWKLPEKIRSRVARTTNPSIQGRWPSIVDDVARYKVQYYCILDDRPNEFPRKLPQLVECVPDVGISDRDARKALLAKLTELTELAKSQNPASLGNLSLDSGTDPS